MSIAHRVVKYTNGSVVDYRFHPDRKATIITAPFSGGQPKNGTELGPKFILDAGFKSQIEELGWEVDTKHPLEGTNYEDLRTDEKDQQGLKNVGIVSDCCHRIYKSIKETAASGRLPITIGGDHSIGTGTLAAMLEHNPDTCVLWIDAHADINTPLTTELGNLHGCPVSFVMGLDSESYPKEYQWVPKVLKPNRIAYIGLRDVDAGEREIIRKYNIPAFSMHHIDKYGIGKVFEMALDKINPNREFPVHMSYDVDAIDPSFVPATGTRVEGGLSLREGLYIAEAIAESGLLSSLDIVETNPLLGENQQNVLDTVGAACAIGRCAMGQTLL